MRELIIDSSQNLETLYRQLGYNDEQNSVTQIVLSPEKAEDKIEKIALWLHQSLMRPVMEELFVTKFDYLLDYEEKDIRKRMLKLLRENEMLLTRLLTPKLIRFAEDFSHINLEGFSVFCIKEYKDAFYILMEECIDTYLAEQDYLDFLELLRLYLKMVCIESNRSEIKE